MGRFSASLAGVAKVDNHVRSAPDKIEIRRNVLGEVGATVFDAFAGAGHMYRAVWKDAPGYVGCDKRWFPKDDRLAYVSDNLRVLRAIDLKPFGIFDLDAYGSPWEQAFVVAARRPVKPGERIGFCLTDGSSIKLKMGGAPIAMAQLAGLNPKAVGLAGSHDEVIERALHGLAARMRCTLTRLWRARGTSAAKVIYLGVVMEGLPAS